MPSFWVDSSEVNGDRVVLLDDEAHHLCKVRRYSRSDLIEVTDGQGGFFKVRLEEVTPKRVEGIIVERFFERGESKVDLFLAQSLIKGGRFGGLVEKATEVGISAVYPHYSDRGIPRNSSGVKTSRWQRLAKAATKQSGRSRFPVICDPVDYSKVLKILSEKCDVVFVGVLGEQPLSVTGLVDKKTSTISIGLLVGPEGGFTSDEISEAVQVGAVPFSWGDRVLRADTAGVVLSALLISLFENELFRNEGEI